MLGNPQLPYTEMQPPREDQEHSDFTLAAMNSLFDPSLLSSPRLGTHGRNLSSESATSFVDACLSSSSPTQSAWLSNRHTHSSAYEPYPRQSPNSRKRPVSEDEEQSDDADPLDPNATDEQKKEYKRRQNTLAARRSRARRAHEVQLLRDENSRLKTEVVLWKERARMMQDILERKGIEFAGLPV